MNRPVAVDAHETSRARDEQCTARGRCQGGRCVQAYGGRARAFAPTAPSAGDGHDRAVWRDPPHPAVTGIGDQERSVRQRVKSTELPERGARRGPAVAAEPVRRRAICDDEASDHRRSPARPDSRNDSLRWVQHEGVATGRRSDRRSAHILRIVGLDIDAESLRRAVDATRQTRATPPTTQSTTSVPSAATSTSTGQRRAATPGQLSGRSRPHRRAQAAALRRRGRCRRPGAQHSRRSPGRSPPMPDELPRPERICASRCTRLPTCRARLTARDGEGPPSRRPVRSAARELIAHEPTECALLGQITARGFAHGQALLAPTRAAPPRTAINAPTPTSKTTVPRVATRPPPADPPTLPRPSSGVKPARSLPSDQHRLVHRRTRVQSPCRTRPHDPLRRGSLRALAADFETCFRACAARSSACVQTASPSPWMTTVAALSVAWLEQNRPRRAPHGAGASPHRGWPHREGRLAPRSCRRRGVAGRIARSRRCECGLRCPLCRSSGSVAAGGRGAWTARRSGVAAVRPSSGRVDLWRCRRTRRSVPARALHEAAGGALGCRRVRVRASRPVAATHRRAGQRSSRAGGRGAHR